MTTSLRQLQSWFQAVITHPDGVAAGVASPAAADCVDQSANDLTRTILPSQQMSSLDRLQIYGRAYFGRLIDCLRVQFPAVRHALGDASFDGIAFGYLIRHPSHSYTLSLLGESFADYLQEIRPTVTDSAPDFADFVIELARLERTYSEVFDGPGTESAEAIHSAMLADLSPESFGDSRLILFDCVHLLKLRFPSYLYVSSLRQGLEPEIPSARTTFLVVTRRDFVVRRFEVTGAQFQLLSAIQQGATISEALQKLTESAEVNPSALDHELNQWFCHWTAAPLFAGVWVSPGRNHRFNLDSDE